LLGIQHGGTPQRFKKPCFPFISIHHYVIKCCNRRGEISDNLSIAIDDKCFNTGSITLSQNQDSITAVRDIFKCDLVVYGLPAETMVQKSDFHIFYVDSFAVFDNEINV